MKKKQEQVDIGYIDIPKEYNKFPPERKKDVCINIIDMLLLDMDKYLDPTINRIDFLNEVLESSLVSNEDLEQYEVAQVLYDCIKELNDN
jgi:hypothetical protein